MYLDKYVQENGISTNYPIFNLDNEKVYRKISTTDLFLAQFCDNYFNAIDIVVKYLAIENYYNYNSFGMKLYEKMQKKRINENWNSRYANLIKSFEEKGYVENSFINTDLNYSIHDGAHRLALALYHNIPFINIVIYNTFVYRRKYDISWFVNNDFTQEEILLIENKLKFLLNKCQQPYISFVWPTAIKLIDNLVYDLNNDFQENVSVLSKTKLTINKNTFENFISGIYEIDDIIPENLVKKLNYMKKSMEANNILTNLNYDLFMLQLKIYNPKFRLKPISGLPQSKETMNIKKTLRNRYKDKINEYQHDIMIHITDNQIQNLETQNFLNKFIYTEETDYEK